MSGSPNSPKPARPEPTISVIPPAGDLESSDSRKIMSESEHPRGSGQGPAAQQPASADSIRVSPTSDAPPQSSNSIMDAPDESALLLKQLTVGTVVDGKYKIDEIIGRGAMGVVVAATHVHLKERVALKFLSARQASQTNDFQARFRREAQVSAKLRNEHITRVIDVGVWRELIPFMVMDHLVGQRPAAHAQAGPWRPAPRRRRARLHRADLRGARRSARHRDRPPRPQAFEPLRHQAPRRLGADQNPRLRDLEVVAGGRAD